MVFQKKLTHLLVWVACDSLLRKRILLHSHTHQPIKCKHAFFKYPWVNLRNDKCLQKSPRGWGEGFTFWPTDYKLYARTHVKITWQWKSTLRRNERKESRNLMAKVEIENQEGKAAFFCHAASFLHLSPLNDGWKQLKYLVFFFNKCDESRAIMEWV